MDEATLQTTICLGLDYNNDLMEIMGPWTLQLQNSGTSADVKTAERCKTLSKSIFDTFAVAYDKADNLMKEADNAKKMTHYIADKAIKDAVSRLAAQMRTQNPRTPMVAVVLEMFLSSPQGNDKRKDLEARIKAKMGLRILGVSDDKSGEFAEKVEVFEEKAGELALKFAIEDAKKMVDENLGSLAMA